MLYFSSHIWTHIFRFFFFPFFPFVYCNLVYFLLFLSQHAYLSQPFWRSYNLLLKLIFKIIFFLPSFSSFTVFLTLFCTGTVKCKIKTPDIIGVPVCVCRSQPAPGGEGGRGPRETEGSLLCRLLSGSPRGRDGHTFHPLLNIPPTVLKGQSNEIFDFQFFS